MLNELMFFASSAALLVLLVPLVSGSPILHDACAAIRDPKFDTGRCTGDRYSTKGETCCWRVKVPGKILADTMCQTCKATCDSKGNCTEKCNDPKRQLQATTTGPGFPLEDGVLEDSTAPGSDNGLTTNPGGVLQMPQGNQTFSGTTNSTK
ncbi:MAG TPA: hypothetical protein VF248_07375 [Nitrososphaeraceae archaeon]